METVTLALSFEEGTITVEAGKLRYFSNAVWGTEMEILLFVRSEGMIWLLNRIWLPIKSDGF
jgi:hypothetical protein